MRMKRKKETERQPGRSVARKGAGTGRQGTRREGEVAKRRRVGAKVERVVVVFVVLVRTTSRALLAVASLSGPVGLDAQAACRARDSRSGPRPRSGGLREPASTPMQSPAYRRPKRASDARTRRPSLQWGRKSAPLGHGMTAALPGCMELSADDMLSDRGRLRAEDPCADVSARGGDLVQLEQKAQQRQVVHDLGRDREPARPKRFGRTCSRPSRPWPASRSRSRRRACRAG